MNERINERINERNVTKMTFEQKARHEGSYSQLIIMLIIITWILIQKNASFSVFDFLHHFRFFHDEKIGFDSFSFWGGYTTGWDGNVKRHTFPSSFHVASSSSIQSCFSRRCQWWMSSNFYLSSKGAKLDASLLASCFHPFFYSLCCWNSHSLFCLLLRLFAWINSSCWWVT